MLSEQHKAQHVRDRELLQGPLTEREAEIADAARRLAFDQAGDWLSQKEAKSLRFRLYKARAQMLETHRGALERYSLSISEENGVWFLEAADIDAKLAPFIKYTGTVQSEAPALPELEATFNEWMPTGETKTTEPTAAEKYGYGNEIPLPKRKS